MINSEIETETWSRLQTDMPKGDMLTARTAFPKISKKLLAGLDANGIRHFLISLEPAEMELNDNQSRGIRVICNELRIKNLAQNLQSMKYMDIICQDNAGHEAFNIIGQEIAVSIESSSISKSELIRGILSKWRRFWGHIPTNSLSAEEIIGLFSEIWFLNRWLFSKMDALSAISIWRGPYASRHDFEWPNKSVEVKGTTSTKGRIHWIHGLEQLSPPEGGELYFFSLRLREEGGAAYTLPGLIEECRKILLKNPEALTNFENSLALTGYSPVHDNEYLKIHFRVVDESLYAVRDSFPRITTGIFQNGVPSGVETVRYEVNLEGFDSLIIARSSSDKWDI